MITEINYSNECEYSDISPCGILYDRLWQDPDSKVHEANMGPTWGRQDPGGPEMWATRSLLSGEVKGLGLIYIIFSLSPHDLSSITEVSSLPDFCLCKAVCMWAVVSSTSIVLLIGPHHRKQKRTKFWTKFPSLAALEFEILKFINLRFSGITMEDVYHAIF